MYTVYVCTYVNINSMLGCVTLSESNFHLLLSPSVLILILEIIIPGFQSLICDSKKYKIYVV
jgi:hypothetical protein